MCVCECELVLSVREIEREGEKSKKSDHAMIIKPVKTSFEIFYDFISSFECMHAHSTNSMRYQLLSSQSNYFKASH